MPKPRFFVDENMLPVGQALAAVRNDVVYPGHADLPEVNPGDQDPKWLPIIGRAQKDLVLLTRDSAIRRRDGERELLTEHKVRAIFLTGKKNMTKFEKLRLVMARWDRIEKQVQEGGPGPWSVGLTESGTIKAL